MSGLAPALAALAVLTPLPPAAHAADAELPQAHAARDVDSPRANRRVARRMAAKRGWRGRQWSCLRALWTRESGFRRKARNASSGAYGIPQALPGRKLYTAGRAIHTARVQVRWGLGYIGGRYRVPCAALAHSNAVGWY